MKFAPYTSGRLKQLKIGITSYSENKTSLEVVGSVSIGGSITGNITGNVNATSGLSTFTNLNVTGVSTFGGNVAIGTDNVTDPVGVGNTSVLAVGILTAYRLYSTVFGEFTGGSVVADNIVGSALSVSGISTLGFVKISSGIITAASGVVTYFGDGSGLTGVGATEDVKTNSLQVLGISTFTGDLDVNGNIIGDSATNIITPLMVYFPLILIFCQRWQSSFGIGSLTATMLPYSIGLMIVGLLMTIGWVVLDFPLGPGANVFIEIPGGVMTDQ